MLTKVLAGAALGALLVTTNAQAEEGVDRATPAKQPAGVEVERLHEDEIANANRWRIFSLVAVGAGGAFGAVGLAHALEENPSCKGGGLCDLNREVGAVMAMSGGALVLAGLFRYVVATNQAAEAERKLEILRVSPTTTGSGPGLVVVGTF
jgi:hypothetical protein